MAMPRLIEWDPFRQEAPGPGPYWSPPAPSNVGPVGTPDDGQAALLGVLALAQSLPAGFTDSCGRGYQGNVTTHVRGTPGKATPQRAPRIPAPEQASMSCPVAQPSAAHAGLDRVLTESRTAMANKASGSPRGCSAGPRKDKDTDTRSNPTHSGPPRECSALGLAGPGALPSPPPTSQQRREPRPIFLSILAAAWRRRVAAACGGGACLQLR